MKTIPHSYPAFGREEKNASSRVLDSFCIAQGPKVEEFEHRFARSVDRKYGVAVSSGTAALVMALKALGISAKDKVAIPSYTCTALLHALDFTGAKPLITDISAEDMNLCAADLKRRLTSKTAAVMVPHLFGRATDMRSLLRLGVPVIEDGTQALGARTAGKSVGSFGVMSVFSFYATKMITTGEGGMIVTDSSALARKLKDMRDYDKKNTYRFRMNFKMTDLQAAIGIEQLKKLPDFVRARRKIAGFYTAALSSSRKRGSDSRFRGNDRGLVLPFTSNDRAHVYFRYVLRVPGGAARLLRHLNRKGIEAKSPIFKPLHRYLGLPDRDYPETARALRQACSLPIYPALSADKARAIAREIRGYDP